jgi:uncharacterized protein YqgV (UPF0045/DUF77 family)
VDKAVGTIPEQLKKSETVTKAVEQVNSIVIESGKKDNVSEINMEEREDNYEEVPAKKSKIEGSCCN